MLPPNCNPASDCIKAFSYQVVGNQLEMQLFGVIQSETLAYIAVGFSDDPCMGGEMVTECSNMAGDQNSFSARLSYNMRKDASVPNTPRNIRIANLTAADMTLMLPQSTAQMMSINGRTTVYCIVRQNIVPIPNQPLLQTLTGSYYLLMAAGPTSGAELTHHYGTNGAYPGPLRVLDASGYAAPSTTPPPGPSCLSQGTTTTSSATTLSSIHSMMMTLAAFVVLSLSH